MQWQKWVHKGIRTALTQKESERPGNQNHSRVLNISVALFVALLHKRNETIQTRKPYQFCMTEKSKIRLSSILGFKWTHVGMFQKTRPGSEKRYLSHSSSLNMIFAESKLSHPPKLQCTPSIGSLWVDLFQKVTHDNSPHRKQIYNKSYTGFDNRQTLCAALGLHICHDHMVISKSNNFGIYFLIEKWLPIFLSCQVTTWCYCRISK